MFRYSVVVCVVVIMASAPALWAQQMLEPKDEPLLDWSPWEQYRTTVEHPAATVKPADLERVQGNIEKWPWAQRFSENTVRGAGGWLEKLTPEYLAEMIPATTPGDALFTPCPACRDQNKPAHPHGQWSWHPDRPRELVCQICETVYPNEQYPEDIVFTTRHGGGQTITYCSAPPFNVFGFTTRPSFAANARARSVGYMAQTAQRLAEAYILSRDPDFARAVRLILLRFAEVYPDWLVHVGYGEWADSPPHIAALNIGNLPDDEITPPPNTPDRNLHSRYWQGGRATGTGMEGTFVRRVVEAYTQTCRAEADGEPVYSEQDRLRIERDLLLESTVLLVADKQVNNKSVGNATAAALVGMVTGHPGLVRFGLDIFLSTVDGWFLPDGAPSESWAYGMMTLGGIEALGQAFRGYSDPPGHRDADGKRIDNLDLYHDTAYAKVWEAMFQGLQGNLLYPPIADSYRTTGIGNRYAELMAANYPEKEHFQALLREFAGEDFTGGNHALAIYLRDPDIDRRTIGPLTFTDYLFPEMRFGQFRSGLHGRESMLILNASHWDGHHHLDSLDLYYWKDGRELLTDLGYLWDHPDKYKTYRTFAHNTVMVDGRDQISAGRGGEFLFFSPNGPLKVMEAESQAYPQAGIYRRTVAQVEHGPGRNYVLDIFRVAGGAQHDYVFHGPNDNLLSLDEDLEPFELTPEMRFCLRFPLNAPDTEIWVDNLSITTPDGRELALNPSAAVTDPETGLPTEWGVYIGNGTAEWGQGTAPGETDTAAWIKAVEPGELAMNVALIAGDSDGYRGDNALVSRAGETCTVRFRLRGNASAVPVQVLYWPSDAASAADRRYLTISGIGTVVPTQEWKEYTGTFTLPGRMDLDNARFSPVAQARRLLWTMDEEMTFAAHWPGADGETFIIGDGWGQRDHRNSDRGAVLPYIIRRREAAPMPSVFVSAFEGYMENEAVVREVALLDVPEDEADNTVAVMVRTRDGNDYLVSCMQARPVRIETPDGVLEVDGRFAAISVQNGQTTLHGLVEGTLLRWNGTELLAADDDGA